MRHVRRLSLGLLAVVTALTVFLVFGLAIFGLAIFFVTGPREAVIPAVVIGGLGFIYAMGRIVER